MYLLRERCLSCSVTHSDVWSFPCSVHAAAGECGCWPSSPSRCRFSEACLVHVVLTPHFEVHCEIKLLRYMYCWTLLLTNKPG